MAVSRPGAGGQSGGVDLGDGFVHGDGGLLGRVGQLAHIRHQIGLNNLGVSRGAA